MRALGCLFVMFWAFCIVMLLISFIFVAAYR